MKDLAEASEQLTKHVEELAESVDWASDEIKRLRAENEELRLKIKNQAYFIRVLLERERPLQ